MFQYTVDGLYEFIDIEFPVIVYFPNPEVLEEFFNNY